MTDSATERIRGEWDEQAAAWHAWAPRMFEDSRPIHEWMVRKLDPRPGERVLEVGAGPGDTGFLAAPRLGDGRLVSTDIAPHMVEVARTRGADRGLHNVDYELLDAQAMHFDDHSFDGILCRWILMLVPNPPAAFKECFRVLKTGGRLVFAVFTGADENPWVSLPVRTLVKAGHMRPPGAEWRPGILALADRAKLESLLSGAGFGSPEIEGVDMAWTFTDFDDYWAFLTTVTALGPLVRSLSDVARGAVRVELNTALSAYTNSSGIRLPARCWCGCSTRTKNNKSNS
jgi:SAM-dependent methyltransferase